MVQVQDDDGLLEACLKEQGNRAIAVARGFINRAQEGKTDVGETTVKQHKRRKQAATAVLSRAAAEVRKTLFNLVAENGKKIRDLTGDELDKLESNNVARANLYRELRKQVKGDQIVGEVLDDEHFKRIVDHIGDVKELVELFD
jgi:vacuolar-type H+-ATPase subunit E/Vma4